MGLESLFGEHKEDTEVRSQVRRPGAADGLVLRAVLKQTQSEKPLVYFTDFLPPLYADQSTDPVYAQLQI